MVRLDHFIVGAEYLIENQPQGVDADFALNGEILALVVDAVQGVLHIGVLHRRVKGIPDAHVVEVVGLTGAVVGLDDDQRVGIVLLNGGDQLQNKAADVLQLTQIQLRRSHCQPTFS